MSGQDPPGHEVDPHGPGPDHGGGRSETPAQQMASGQKQGLGMVYGMIQSQAWLLAYNDAYRLLAVCALLCAPFCLLLNRAGGGASVASE